MAVAKEQIRQIISENNISSVADVYMLLKDSFKDILQELMEAELDATLGSSDRWSADFVRLCDFLGWKSGLRCHGGGIHLLFLASVKDFYCWKRYESSDLSGISGRG